MAKRTRCNCTSCRDYNIIMTIIVHLGRKIITVPWIKHKLRRQLSPRHIYFSVPCHCHKIILWFLKKGKEKLYRVLLYFFLRLHSTTKTLITHVHSHPYAYTYANSTPISIFEDWAGKSSRLNSRDWRRHHMRLVVDGNVAYHWMHNAIKSQNIRFHEESNRWPQMLPRLL